MVATKPSGRICGLTVFPTAIGFCGIAWRGSTLLAVQLPEKSEAETRARLLSRHPGLVEQAPPTPMLRLIEAITQGFDGRRRRLPIVELDVEDVPPFHQRVYEMVQGIPAGETWTYGEVAAALGSPGASRAVGQAMRRNRFPIVVPCHRVVAAGKKIGGFTAPGGTETKVRMLAIEGSRLAPARGGAGANTGSLGPEAEFLCKADPKLAKCIRRVGALGLAQKPTTTVFAALAEAIIYQQLAGKAAATIHGRVCGLFPASRRGLEPESIASSSDELLRSAGLSRPKMLALRDLSARTLAGEIPNLAALRRMPDDEIVASLTKVRGIGRWTVEMLLMFRLGRPDVLPLEDFGVKKGFARVFGMQDLPSRDQLAARGERWRPYRSAASWYLWRAADERSA